MIKKIKLAIVRMLRNLSFWMSNVCTKKADHHSWLMVKYANSKKKVQKHREYYVLYTKQSVNCRDFVGKCNLYLIRNK